jgi:hypothetical protein
LVALIALGNDIKLGILPNSHDNIRFQGKQSLCQAIEYTFSKGDILIMHPLLVHYGCAYTAEENSLRAHCYFDNLLLQRKPEADGRETYLFTANFQPIEKPAKGVKLGQNRTNNSRGKTKTKNT